MEIQKKRSSYQVADDCVLGKEKELILKGLPGEWMHVQQIIIASMCEGFFELDALFLDNKRVDKFSSSESEETIFLEMQDGYFSDPFEIHRQAAHPWIWQDNGKQGVILGPNSGRTEIIMRYTGLIPPGYQAGYKFKATVLFMGPIAHAI